MIDAISFPLATPISRMKIAWQSLKNIGMHLNARPGARSTAPAYPSHLQLQSQGSNENYLTRIKKKKKRHAPERKNASPGARSTLASPKCCACHARWGPTAARETTPQPFRQLPNAAPATQTQAQVHEVLRLTRFHACISKVLRVPRKMGAHSRARFQHWAHSRARDNTPAL